MVSKGRHDLVQGAHTLGHNKDTIGICLEGTDRFSDRQAQELTVLLSSLCKQYNISVYKIHGHSDFERHKNRRCPNTSMAFVRECVLNFDRYTFWFKASGGTGPDLSIPSV